MQHISKLKGVGDTIFSQMSALAKEYNALNLSQGFPNFSSDSTLINLVYKAMKSGYNQYAPMAGSLELREAIAQKIENLYGAVYHPESEIVVTAGATQAIYTIISSYIRPKDEVIIFKPAYDCYEPTITLNGGKTISIQLEAPFYHIDWDVVKSRITKNTKMVIINSPQNPSGTLFSEKDMLQLQALTKNTDIIVLSDEVYEHIIFDNEKHQSCCLFSDLKQRSYMVASFGKTFHNTGWKLGYCCAPKFMMKEFKKIHQFNVFCVNHPMQIALAEYIKNPKNYNKLPAFYQKKRDYFLDLIAPSRFTYIPSKGTYFQSLCYAEISEDNDINFARDLTINHGIASIPMSVFNENNLDLKQLRFCFAKTTETIEKAALILNQI